MVGAQGPALPGACWVSGRLLPSSLSIHNLEGTGSPALLKGVGNLISNTQADAQKVPTTVFAHLGIHRRVVTARLHLNAAHADRHTCTVRAVGTQHSHAANVWLQAPACFPW